MEFREIETERIGVASTGGLSPLVWRVLRRYDTLITVTIATSCALTVSFLPFVIYYDPPRWSQIIFAAFLGAATISAVGLTLLRDRYARAIGSNSFREPSMSATLEGHMVSAELRRMFYVVVARMSPAQREELIYMLYDRFLEVPPEVAVRYGERLALQFNFGPDQILAFLQWVTEFTKLPTTERRLVLEELRSSVLR
jgi:hypothetical protein